MLKKLVLYLRAPFFIASFVPVTLGAALAYKLTRRFDFALFLITAIGVMAANGGVNLLNDYVDFKSGCDPKNRFRSKYSGGSPFLTMGAEKPRTFLLLSAICFTLALLCGIYLAMRVDGGFGPIIALTLVGGVFGILYNTTLSYKGVGEFFVFILLGPLAALGAYYVQTGVLSLKSVIVSMPVGLLVLAILWVNEIPDIEADLSANKRTLATRLSSRTSAVILGGIFTATYLWVLGLAISGYGLATLLALLPAPVAYKAALQALDYHDSPKFMIVAQRDTIVTHLATGLLLIVGILI